MNKFLIVGLGNPGSEYADTRHNIGFKIAEQLAFDLDTSFQPSRLAEVAHCKYKGKIIIIIKPNTFMNLSGKAVNYWLQTEKIEVNNCMVILDELALPFGKIRIGPKGSDGGHNGLKDIQAQIGTTEYPRLRFGINNAFNKGHQSNYVLGQWNDEELKTLNERIKIAADAIKSFSFIGLQRCMNEYNNK
ncbi:MAG: aminoacyl-tRNA hydrolase [Bacteroidetes bacterium]|nr:aminoacyl-tRNA hydrolase [Bacteroidota bacterium]